MRINKRESAFFVLIAIVVLTGVGYAYLTTNLNIIGSTSLSKATWDIHFENVKVKDGSVTATLEPTINAKKDTVTYEVTLSTPGEFYEFTVDAKNAGTIDGMIESVTSKLNGSVITTLPNYLEYSVTYEDGTEIEEKQLLKTNTKETYKVHIEYKSDVAATDLPNEDQNLSLSFSVLYKQADDSAEEVIHSESFAKDDWDTVLKVVKYGKKVKYNVGDTKEIDMGEFGTHTLRIANMSTPEECLDEEFSETACGFVVEFADIIALHRMNHDTYGGRQYGDGNNGGWPATELYQFVQNDIYNAMPNDIKKVIKDTKVISGHSSINEDNFITNDKLYLLSRKEIWNTLDTYSTDIPTRQLDYYRNNGVTDSNYTIVPKNYNGESKEWWTRSTIDYDSDYFYWVSALGYSNSGRTTNEFGISPAFRIG